MRLAFVWLLALLLFADARSSSAQSHDQLASCRDRRPAMRNTLADIQRRQRNVGLSAVVMLGGETVLAENLGYADLEHRVPVTGETRFGVASITKAFTGLALLKLHEAGRIDLDAPIQRYVPAFPVKPGGTITPRLLAAHLAGIRHWGNERNAALYARHFDDINDVLALFKDDTLVSAPGSAEHYSSYGYNLIGAAIQSVSGTKYQDFVRREIIVRLGRAIEKPGLLSAESIALLTKRPRVGSVESDMSFGFFVSPDTAAHRRLNIGGSNAGVQSGLTVYPDEDLVIAVISNTWGIGS